LIAWVVIYSAPPRQFYADVRAREFLDPSIGDFQILASIADQSSGTSGEAPNTSVTLRDPMKCDELFAIPPLAKRAVIMTSQGILFDGFVENYELGDAGATIGIEQ
jgi:hypothetical protein